MKARLTVLFVAGILLGLIFFSGEAIAASDNMVCGVYFTGNGCPHCAKVKPAIDAILKENPNLVMIKYEIYDDRENAPIIMDYAKSYGFDPGIPLIIFGKNDILIGDKPITDGLKASLALKRSNPCPLPDGRSADFSICDFSVFPGKIEVLRGSSAALVNASNSTNQACSPPIKQELTVAKIVSLSLYDAINPCVYAIIVFILLAILTNDPKKKHRVLYAGLAFALAVFIIYFLYGLLIVKFFQLVQGLAGIKFFLYKAMAVLAIMLGILNLRDFWNYRPGRLGTEMPIMFRPKVRKIVSKVTSPLGAFFIGSFVTIFLLPCTIGPYIIAGGILSSLDLLNAMPWLLLYNLIFVIPIVAVTLVVFFGFATVESVSGWKDKNIRYLHLAEGLLVLLLGIAMLFGWL